MITKVNGTQALVFIFSVLMRSNAVAAIPTPWVALAPSECSRLTVAAWIDMGRPIDNKEFPQAICSDYERFSSTLTPDFLIHQDEYTGGGGFYRWFVLEGFNSTEHPGILAQSRKSTARFVSIGGEYLLEEFDGESITLSRWNRTRLQPVLKYRANDFYFQMGPAFGALRVFNPSTKEFFVVKYSAEGRDAIINFKYTWKVDRYAPFAGTWMISETDMALTKALKSKLRRLDSNFAKQLSLAEKGAFSFDREFGWDQLRQPMRRATGP